MSQRNSDSLLFYMYCPHSKCSEARRHQVKAGLTLAEVAQVQETAFKCAIPRQNSRVSLDFLPKHGPSVLDNPKIPASGANYFPIQPVETLSPAMVEYVGTPTFDRAVEQKKHRQLKRYFHEKYRLFSRLLSEDVLAGVLNVTSECAERGSGGSSLVEEKGGEGSELLGLEFQQGINRVNAEVEAIVEARFQRQKAENTQKKRLEILKQRFSEKAKKPLLSPSLSPISAQSLTRLASPKAENQTFAWELKEEIPKLPLLVGQQSPAAVIRENERICRSLGRHFLHNLPKARRTKSTTSFFLT